MPTATDALGRTVTLAQPATRVISLVPSVTESVVAFGRASSLTAVTKFCVEPPEVTTALRKVGGTKNPDLEAILTLQPDLVLANVEENRREDVESLIAAGLNVFVGYPRTVAAAAEELEAIAQLVGGIPGGALVRSAREALARQQELNESRPRVRVFCPIWRNPYMAVGGDTYAGDVIRLAGGVNVFEHHPSGARYPQVTLREITAADPQVILLPDEPYQFRERHRDEFLVHRDIEAVRERRLFLVDGRWLTWYGPRMSDGLRTVEILLDKARREWSPPPEESKPKRASTRSLTKPAGAKSTSKKPDAAGTGRSSGKRRSSGKQRSPRDAGTPPLPPGLRLNVDQQDVVDEGR